jgi:hypothetical protein
MLAAFSPRKQPEHEKKYQNKITYFHFRNGLLEIRSGLLCIYQKNRTDNTGDKHSQKNIFDQRLLEKIVLNFLEHNAIL